MNGLKQCINHRSFLLTSISIPISLIFYFWHGKEKIVKSSRVYFECSISQVNDDHSITVAVPPIWISHLGPIGKSTRMMTMMIGEGYKIVITVRSAAKAAAQVERICTENLKFNSRRVSIIFGQFTRGSFSSQARRIFLKFQGNYEVLNAHVITR